MKTGDHVRYFHSVPAMGNDTAQEAVYGTVTKVDSNGSAWVRVSGLGTVLLSQKKCELLKKANVSPAPATTGLFSKGTDTMATKVIIVKKASKTAPVAKTTAKATKAKKESANPRAVGKTLGLGTMQTWIQVFQQNAKKKLSDDQISKFMHKEFPDSTATDFDNVHRVRGFYNSGKRFPAPKVSYKRYDEEGNVIEGRVRKEKAEKAPTAKKVTARGVKASPKSPVVEKGRFQLKKSV